MRTENDDFFFFKAIIQILCSTYMRKLKWGNVLELGKSIVEIKRHYTDKKRKVATNLELSDRTGGEFSGMLLVGD